MGSSNTTPGAPTPAAPAPARARRDAAPALAAPAGAAPGDGGRTYNKVVVYNRTTKGPPVTAMQFYDTKDAYGIHTVFSAEYRSGKPVLVMRTDEYDPKIIHDVAILHEADGDKCMLVHEARTGDEVINFVETEAKFRDFEWFLEYHGVYKQRGGRP